MIPAAWHLRGGLRRSHCMPLPLALRTALRHPSVALCLVAALSFWALSWQRLQRVDAALGAYTGCARGCFDQAVLGSDTALFGTIAALVVLGAWLPRRWKPLAMGALALAWLAFAIDIFVFSILNHRLHLSDILRYAGNVQLNGTVAAPALGSAQGLGLALPALLGMACTLALVRQPWARVAGGLLLPAGLLLPLYPLDDANAHISAHLYKNVIANNLPSGEDRPFLAAYAARLREAPEPPQRCDVVPATQPRPVILVVVESLSLYHSRLLSGLRDDTPGLDQIAQRYAYLEHFHANGFTTDGGLIALLAGHVPLPTVNRYHSFSAYLGFESARQDAYEALAGAGIRSFYFRTADLGFIRTGDWLQSLGFDTVEGPEAPFYDSLPRGSFDDPGDAALYRRFLAWLDQEPERPAYFAVLQTTTTHPPFVVPGEGAVGEDQAMQYADRELAALVAGLEHRGYFDQGGLMVITGDHRAMTVLHPEERRRLGREAPSRVPALLLGREFHGVGKVAGRWQQADFLPSLLAANGLASCTDALHGRFLGAPRGAEAILHAQGHARDRVMVHLPQQAEPLEIQLDGDETRWVQPPAAPLEVDLVAEINRQRALRPEAPGNLAAGVLRWYGFDPEH